MVQTGGTDYGGGTPSNWCGIFRVDDIIYEGWADTNGSPHRTPFIIHVLTIKLVDFAYSDSIHLVMVLGQQEYLPLKKTLLLPMILLMPSSVKVLRTGYHLWNAKKPVCVIGGTSLDNGIYGPTGTRGPTALGLFHHEDTELDEGKGDICSPHDHCFLI